MLAPQKNSGLKSAIAFFAVAVLLGGVWLARFFAKAPEKIEGEVAATEAQALTPAASPAQATSTPTAITAPPPASSPSSNPTPAAATSGSVSPELGAAFAQLRTETLATIPTQKDLRKLDPEQVHFTPQQVIAASLKIGEIAQMVQDHPELAEEALKFYKQCAENLASPNSVRASCFVDFERLARVHATSIAEPHVTEHVRQLAAKIGS